MAYEGKKAADKWFPVRLVDGTDHVTAKTSIAYGDLTVYFGTEAATSGTAYTPATGDWKNQGLGNYWLRMGADEFAAAGKYIVNVAATGCDPFAFVVEVTTATAEELQAVINALATATNLSTVDTVVDAVKVVTDQLAGMLVTDGAVKQFTANALELGPAGEGGGAASAADTAMLTMLEADGEKSRFTAAALANAPDDALLLQKASTFVAEEE